MVNATTEKMLEILKKKGKSSSEFHKGTVIHVNDKMQKGYSYTLEEEPGQNLAFKPYATPEEMLCMGVFEGKYMNDCLEEFPMEWFVKAIALGKLSPQGADPSVNALGVKSRQPLQAWKKAGWVPGGGKAKLHPILSNRDTNPDIRGWFQWYCRYWCGRRMEELDKVQISRWKAFTRHSGQIKKNCKPGDLSCRPVQRQALINWSHNGFM
jgi:hypothetical protein